MAEGLGARGVPVSVRYEALSLFCSSVVCVHHLLSFGFGRGAHAYVILTDGRSCDCL
jgi:hypothetical protein